MESKESFTISEEEKKLLMELRQKRLGPLPGVSDVLSAMAILILFCLAIFIWFYGLFALISKFFDVKF